MKMKQIGLSRESLEFFVLLYFLSLPFTTPYAQLLDSYVPMDPIPEIIEELPDPCDNPTTRMWGPDDEKGNLN